MDSHPARLSIFVLLAALSLPACTVDPAERDGRVSPPPQDEELADEPKPATPSTTPAPLAPPGKAGDEVKPLRLEEMQRGVKRSLARGKRPIKVGSVRCPEDLPAVRNARTRCMTTYRGSPLKVTVRVTSATDRRIRYSIRTPPLPR